MNLEILGIVTIDSGTILVGDPCYWGIEHTWSVPLEKGSERIDHESGVEGKSVVVSTGGDGTVGIQGFRNPANDEFEFLIVDFAPFAEESMLTRLSRRVVPAAVEEQQRRKEVRDERGERRETTTADDRLD